MPKKSWIQIHSGPDRNMHYRYTLYWVTNYAPGHPDGEHACRVVGQVFLANPMELGHDRAIEVKRQPEIWEVK